MEHLEPLREEPEVLPPPTRFLFNQPPIPIGDGYETEEIAEAEAEAEPPVAEHPATAEAAPPAAEAGTLALHDTVVEPAVTEPMESTPAPSRPTSDTTATPREVAEANETPEVGEIRPQDRVRFHFVACAHTVANAERIAANLDGCQTVAFERAGRSPTSRHNLEEALNLQLPRLHAGAPSPELDAYITRSKASPYVPAVLPHLPPSVERIRLIDVSGMHPLHAELKAARLLHQAAFDKTWEGGDYDEARQLLEEAYIRFGDCVRGRDAVMTKQLQLIAADEAAIGPRLIGVVMGGLHVGVRSRISNEGFASTGVPWLESPDPHEIPPDFMSELILRRVNDPQASFTPMEMKRALLEVVQFQYGYYHDPAALRAALLPDEAVTSLLGQLKALRASGLSHEEQAEHADQLLSAAGKTIPEDEAIRYLEERDERRRNY